jgi:hypothetical protein
MKKCYKESRKKAVSYIFYGWKDKWIGHILSKELPSKTRYGRKDRRKDRSDGKTRKKT